MSDRHCRVRCSIRPGVNDEGYLRQILTLLLLVKFPTKNEPKTDREQPANDNPSSTE